jgi:hypothetical protein
VRVCVCVCVCVCMCVCVCVRVAKLSVREQVECNVVAFDGDGGSSE